MRQRHVRIPDLTKYEGTHLSLLQLAESIGVARRTLYYHVDIGALAVVRRRGVLRVTTREALRYAGLEPLPTHAQSVQTLQPR
jgi:hypothetical protein